VGMVFGLLSDHLNNLNEQRDVLAENALLQEFIFSDALDGLRVFVHLCFFASCDLVQLIFFIF
jgi:hypothetical protein